MVAFCWQRSFSGFKVGWTYIGPHPLVLAPHEHRVGEFESIFMIRYTGLATNPSFDVQEQIQATQHNHREHVTVREAPFWWIRS